MSVCRLIDYMEIYINSPPPCSLNCGTRITKEYPKDLVKDCLQLQSNPWGIKNTTPQDNMSVLEGNDTTNNTLLEISNPNPNQMYDTFDIAEFKADTQSGEGVFNAYVSLVKNASRIWIDVDILDIKSERVMLTLPMQEIFNADQLLFDTAFNIENGVDTENIFAIARASWIMADENSENSVSILRPLSSALEIKYIHDRPKKKILL